MYRDVLSHELCNLSSNTAANETSKTLFLIFHDFFFAGRLFLTLNYPIYKIKVSLSHQFLKELLCDDLQAAAKVIKLIQLICNFHFSSTYLMFYSFYSFIVWIVFLWISKFVFISCLLLVHNLSSASWLILHDVMFYLHCCVFFYAAHLMCSYYLINTSIEVNFCDCAWTILPEQKTEEKIKQRKILWTTNVFIVSKLGKTYFPNDLCF